MHYNDSISSSPELPFIRLPPLATTFYVASRWENERRPASPLLSTGGTS